METMRHAILALALILAVPAAHADCDLDAIAKALEDPLGAMTPKEIEVTDVQSTEGGVWEVYREGDGRLNTIIRIDGGESGRQDTRLSVVSRDTYGIASTRTDYLRHAFIEEGPFGIARKTTDYYYFCGGKPHVPGESGAMVDLVEYPKKAMELRAIMLDDKDVAEITKGLTR
jgi:hypothetical protein